MAGRNIDSKTLRFLYGKSGNKCAFPDCNEPIFEEDGTLTGECCHIEAFSPGGARYNPESTIEERNSNENLMMLCARHHKIIDSHPEEYTTERLREMKENHEKQYSRENRELNDIMLYALQHSIKEYWEEIQRIDDEAVEQKFKIKADLSCNIEELLNKIEDVFSAIEKNINSLKGSDEELLNDLQNICSLAGVDYSSFEKIPYYENPFINRNWETHNLFFPNSINHLKMYYLELCVRLYEEFAKLNHSLCHRLAEYKYRLAEHQKYNFYND